MFCHIVLAVTWFGQEHRLSIAGSVIMCIYWIMERNPVGILAYLPNTFIYMRNLHLIRKHTIAAAALTSTQISHEKR